MNERLRGRPLCGPPTQALARGALGLTSGLAEDAAEILERDYDIDAGEVLSMNIDTVETQTSSSEVKSDSADQILGKNGKTATWGSYVFPVDTSTPPGGYGHSGHEGFNYKAAPPTTSGTISNNWDIADRDIKTAVTGSDGSTEILDSKESVVLYKTRAESFEFLRNDAEWQKSNQNDDEGKFIEATYKTIIGGDTTLQGTENLNACGEAWWFFKLSEDNKEGYAICIDNHGHYGCGVFTRYWNQLYVCHYDWNNPIKEHVPDVDNQPMDNDGRLPINPASGVPFEGSAANVTILQKWRVSPMQISPRYEVTVHEKDGKATITVDPDELNAPYSYIGGEPWTYQGYYTGYLKGSEHTDETNNTLIENIQVGNNEAVAVNYYRNKDDYDWDWPGSTQDSVSCTIDLSSSIQNAKTTQAFACYRWNGTYFANNTVDVVMQRSKSFGDIVYEPEWTDGALHMLINMDTKADSTMLGSDGGPRISHQLRPSPAAPPGPPRGWRRTRRRSWRGTTT